ncbi:hypothetical protein M427DRAFT_143755 [Gonapodya prolifera JEL478]|uniref:Uncharacterized protein n=1 Tax=Gonapodya prolifera (strain JEL478) TaxID=1344416 RepID=A0A139APZ5_GONPJ|nr:hypothetical protein M427DRAFT_143755 [Gonapodya prolifera JEL478]|eukprot:KXS18724.1 hypothetical protein M427DRAFT_143755 [Gonapodya prolifera JEL478]
MSSPSSPMMVAIFFGLHLLPPLPVEADTIQLKQLLVRADRFHTALPSDIPNTSPAPVSTTMPFPLSLSRPLSRSEPSGLFSNSPRSSFTFPFSHSRPLEKQKNDNALDDERERMASLSRIVRESSIGVGGGTLPRPVSGSGVLSGQVTGMTLTSPTATTTSTPCALTPTPPHTARPTALSHPHPHPRRKVRPASLASAAVDVTKSEPDLTKTRNRPVSVATMRRPGGGSGNGSMSGSGGLGSRVLAEGVARRARAGRWGHMPPIPYVVAEYDWDAEMGESECVGVGTGDTKETGAGKDVVRDVEMVLTSETTEQAAARTTKPKGVRWEDAVSPSSSVRGRTSPALPPSHTFPLASPITASPTHFASTPTPTRPSMTPLGAGAGRVAPPTGPRALPDGWGGDVNVDVGVRSPGTRKQ